MTSQTGIKTAASQNISKSQTIKFGQLIEYNVRDIFLRNLYKKNEAGRLVLDLSVSQKSFI